MSSSDSDGPRRGQVPPQAPEAQAPQQHAPEQQAPYVEGERVFGPPAGTYDPDWVASAARQRDPGLPPETARLLAGESLGHLRAHGVLDAPDLARRLLAGHPESGATAAAIVASSAVDFCRSYGVDVS